MALDLDAFAVLRAIGAHAALFGDAKADAAKAARALVVKQIKAKGTDLAALRALRKALGEESFALVVDGLKDAELKTLVARVDKENPEAKTASPAWRRRHLMALVTGAAEPAAKAPKAAKAKKPARAKNGAKAGKTAENGPEFLYDESAGVLRKR
ncbi:MAG: hypothetical protein GC182_17200 [Rhodopseudomonas sp.]|nr:hypothetical protein [Rhodopseudomonas sp.]